MKFWAARHVSGILTSKQSPRFQGGYQTLGYTRSLLAESDILLLESQAQNLTLPSGAIKWQSYRLGSERHVISRIAAIPEPDEFGRRGRFFTSSLIIAENIDHVDDCLFDLMRDPIFFSTLDQLLASESLNNEDVSPVTVESGMEWTTEAEKLARAWTGAQMNALFMLMACAGDLAAQAQFVALLGDEEQILNALKVGFLVSPTDVRRHCSFDTLAGMNHGPHNIRFWGQGYPAETKASFVIDGRQFRVTFPESMKLPPEYVLLSHLSSSFRSSVLDQLNSQSLLPASLLNRTYDAFMARCVYQALLQKPDLPVTTDDLRVVDQLTGSHDGLALWLAIRLEDETKRLRILSRMDSRSYAKRLNELRRQPGFRTSKVFAPIFIPTWLSTFSGSYTLEDLALCVSNVAKYGSEEDRMQLVALGEYLASEEREELQNWLQHSSLRLKELRSALAEPNTSTGKSSSIFHRIRHPFGR
jgi:hypothetical protein